MNIILKRFYFSIGFILCLLIVTGVNAQITITDNFKGSSITGITLGGVAQLTSGVIDPVNNGWLRLTPDETDKVGYAYINKSFGSSLGLLVDFEYVSWRETSSGADGFSVFLWDATVPFSIGASGGSLGYAPKTVSPTSAGLAGGYVGIGLDEFGNFSNPTEGRTGGPGSRPDAVAVRGPAPTYTYLSGTATLSASVDYNTLTATRPSPSSFYRRVQFEIKPVTSGPDAGKYTITVRLKTSTSGSFTTILAPYVLPTVPPPMLKLGFASSTGSYINNHEVRNLLITTPGNVRVTKSVDKETAKIGDTLTYQVTVYNETPSPLTDIVLNDKLTDGNGNNIAPAGFTITSIAFNNGGFTGNTSSGTATAHPFTRTINMVANSSVSYTIKGVVNSIPAKNELNNTASITPSPDIIDEDLTNNIATAAVSILASDLSITKTHTGDFYRSTDGSFVIKVTNNGTTATGTATTVTDTLPSGLFSGSSVTVSGSGWVTSYNTTNRVVTATYNGAIASGGTFPDLVVSGTVLSTAAYTSYTNRAWVSNETDPNPANNVATDIVTVSSVNPGSISADQFSCSSSATTFSPSTFTNAASASNGTGRAYRWQMSTDGINFTDIPGTAADNTSYTPPTISVTTYYRRKVTYTTLGTYYSNIVVAALYKDLNTGSIGNDQAFCQSGDPIAFVSLAAASGGMNFEYQWQSSTTSATTGFSNISGATLETYDPSNLTQTTWYRRGVRLVGSGCTYKTTGAAKVTIYTELSPGAIAANQTFCGSGDPAVLTQTTAATGASGTYTYQWQSSTDNVLFDNISGANAGTYDPPVISQTTYFKRVVTSPETACPSETSAAVKITINPALLPGSVGSDQSFCVTGNPSAFTEITPAGGGLGSFSYQWQSSTDNISFNNILSATTATYDAPAVSTTTYYKRVVSSSGSTCTGQGSNVIKVSIYPKPVDPVLHIGN